MLKGYRIATAQRNSELDKIGKEATRLFSRIQNIKGDWSEDHVNAQIDKLGKIHAVQQGIKSASPFPFSTDALIKVIPAIVSPLFSTQILVWFLEHFAGFSKIIDKLK
jgi:hypothetical protein